LVGVIGKAVSVSRSQRGQGATALVAAKEEPVLPANRKPFDRVLELRAVLVLI
jgi:hypothetical protein